MLSFFVFLFGLAVGSFLNAVIFRMEKRESALKGRSYCPSCKHQLSWQDLIPLLSFVLLQGKCRYCRASISLQYPLVELGTAAVFLLIFASGEMSTVVEFLHVGFLFTIASLLVVIFVYDLKHYLIPDKILYSAVFVSGIWYLVFGIFLDLYTKYYILNTLYSALGAAVFFLAIYLVSRGTWMGFGDVKLALFMGLFLGWPNILVALFFAFTAGAVVGVALVIVKKKQFRSQVPFGPFLIAGTFFALFFGSAIAHWYLGLLMV